MSTPVSDTDHISPLKPANDARGDWWQRIFNESEDPQVLCRADGLVAEFNQQAARLWELTRIPTLSQFYVHDALAPIASKKLSQHFLQRHTRQTTFPGLTIRAAGGRNSIADVQVTRLEDDLFLLTFKDTSRHWRVESHAQRLITAINSTADVFYLTDAESRLAFVNAAFQTSTGYSIEDALGRPAEFLKAAEQHDKVRAYTEATRRGEDWVGELLNVRPDGSRYPVEVAVSPVHDREGQYVGYTAVERDITQKNELQKELLTQADFVRGIIDSLDCAIYTLDRDFHLTHCNEGWRKLPARHGRLKLNGDPTATKNFLSLVEDPIHRAELQLLFQEVLESGKPEELSVTDSGEKSARNTSLSTINQPTKHWLVKISPWRHEGETRGLIYAVHDRTRVQELQEQLVLAHKMETMGVLAAGVAHDFNNMLQAIRGRTDMLLARQHDSTDVECLAEIKKASEKAADLTRELLAFSREDGGKVTVIDFNDTIREASVLVNRGTLGRIEVMIVPFEQPAPVQMSSVRATQIVLNLCVNARDAMPNGGRITLTNTLLYLTAKQMEKMGRTDRGPVLRCSVADTGTGMPPEIQARIFDRCFTTKEKGKGTGLGLAIVSNVVAQAGGIIEVQSEVGKGTVFHLYFPLAKGSVTVVPKVETVEPLKKGSGRILVVDDMEEILSLAKAYFESAGFEVFAAHSGEQAVEILEQQGGTIDLLLTDQNMPGMNGVELIETAVKRWPKLKPVLASGNLEDAMRQKIEQEYGSRVLSKPYSMSEAVGVMTVLLSDQKD